MIDLIAEGWDPVQGLPLHEDWPEIEGRPMVHTRNFYRRGDDRLVVEFADGLFPASAILLNGISIGDDYRVLRRRDV